MCLKYIIIFRLIENILKNMFYIIMDFYHHIHYNFKSYKHIINNYILMERSILSTILRGIYIIYHYLLILFSHYKHIMCIILLKNILYMNHHIFYIINQIYQSRKNYYTHSKYKFSLLLIRHNWSYILDINFHLCYI